MTTTHKLDPSRETLHGQFNPELAPALTVKPGDRVEYSTYDVAWGIQGPTDEVSPREKFAPREAPRDAGPCMIGPTAIEGAEPGDTLVIHIEELVPMDWGWTWGGGRGFMSDALNEAVGVLEKKQRLLKWSLVEDGTVWQSDLGPRVRARPFLGTLGICPAGEGWLDAWAPRTRTAGNTDCKELVQGTKLMLPVEVPGALVSLGDAHGAQGDGEVAGCAIECRMKRVALRYELIKSTAFATARAITPTARITLGASTSLDEAVQQALSGMIDWMEEELGHPRELLIALASAVVDVRISQLVNGTVGAHAVWPHDALLSDSQG